MYVKPRHERPNSVKVEILNISTKFEIIFPASSWPPSSDTNVVLRMSLFPCSLLEVFSFVMYVPLAVTTTIKLNTKIILILI